MVNVAQVVKKIIESKPFIHEALNRGIINNAALAEEIIPQVEKELEKKINFSAVNMAIRRFSEKSEKKEVKKIKFSKNTDLSIKTRLIEIIIYKFDGFQQCIKKLYEIVDLSRGDFLTITQGMNEIMIITNQKHEKQIIKAFKEKNTKKVIRNLSSVTLNISEDTAETIGFFYIVTRELTWENINIVDLVSTYAEITIILAEKDTPKAFNVFTEMIRKNEQ